MIQRQTRLPAEQKARIMTYCAENGMTLEEYFNRALRRFLDAPTRVGIYRAVPKATPALHVRFDDDLFPALRDLMDQHQISLTALLYTAICEHAESEGVFA